MFEMIMLAMLVALFVIGFFAPLASRMREMFKLKTSTKVVSVTHETPVKSGETMSFVGYLKTEIEAELFPRPTCSILQRHYDSLVAMEVQNRLAMMAE